MAHVVWRRNSKKVYIYYYDRHAKKLVQLPREKTKHLDTETPDQVLKWVEDWEQDNGLAKARIESITLGADDKLKVLWDHYQENRMALRKRRLSTQNRETELLEHFIAPFFVRDHQRKDPTRWHDLVPEFHTYLLSRQISVDTKKKVLWALERFGKHLVFHRLMTFPFNIQTPARDNVKTTPLKVRKTPDEIISFVRSHHFKDENINFRLAILLGYFAGLHPSELYALEKSDFFTGERATDTKYCKTHKAFTKSGLGSKLSLKIDKTLVGNKVEKLVKSHYSYGVVNIWNVEAAREIASHLKEMPAGRLFPFSRGWLDRAWREKVSDLLQATAHDLRRASALYLGRTKRVRLTLLQEHMRHAEIETTMLYIREPAIPDEKFAGEQDFDDVG